MPALPPPTPTVSRVGVHGTRVSRTYEPSDPEIRKKHVRPFRLSELEVVPREQKALHRALFRVMPEALFDKGLVRRIAEQVSRYAGVSVDMWLHGLRFLETNKLRSLIPGTTCLVVVGLPPRAEKVLVEVDLPFVYRIVGRLLGAKDAPVDLHRPLTEIEQGVFLFLALKVIAIVQEGFTHDEQVGLRIEDLRGSVREAADVLRTERRWLCVALKLNHDLDVGTIRLLVPESLSRTVVLQRPPPGSRLAQRTRTLLRKRLPRLRGATAPAWVEVGRISLTRGELGGLDPGDIILLDEAKVGLRGGVVEGPGELRIGLGRRGYFRGNVKAAGGRHTFEIQEVVVEEVPEPHDPLDVHGELDNPEEVVAAYEGGDIEGYGEDEAMTPPHDTARRAAREARARPQAILDDAEAYDEDYGLDDENDGDDEEYADEQGYGEPEAFGEEGAYEEEPDPPGDDNLEQVEALLGDIPMVLMVELGRVQLTADEIIRLRPGQLIELGRAPTDPVDLVVGGKLVAKGELVEIDGALGVKLLNLAKGAE